MWQIVYISQHIVCFIHVFLSKKDSKSKNRLILYCRILNSAHLQAQNRKNKTKQNKKQQPQKQKQTKGLSITCTWCRLQSYLQAQLKYFKCNSFVLKSDDHGHHYLIQCTSICYFFQFQFTFNQRITSNQTVWLTLLQKYSIRAAEIKTWKVTHNGFEKFFFKKNFL